MQLKPGQFGRVFCFHISATNLDFLPAEGFKYIPCFAGWLSGFFKPLKPERLTEMKNC